MSCNKGSKQDIALKHKEEHILAYRFKKNMGGKMNSLTLKQSPCTFTCFAFKSLFTEFAVTTQECTRSSYQDNMRTHHSSQLTPIYPRAFKKRSACGGGGGVILHLYNITGL